MKQKKVTTGEPLGIVIADGGKEREDTHFSAFVWGPVPDDVQAEWDAAERELELVHH